MTRKLIIHIGNHKTGTTFNESNLEGIHRCAQIIDKRDTKSIRIISGELEIYSLVHKPPPNRAECPL